MPLIYCSTWTVVSTDEGSVVLPVDGLLQLIPCANLQDLLGAFVSYLIFIGAPVFVNLLHARTV